MFRLRWWRGKGLGLRRAEIKPPPFCATGRGKWGAKWRVRDGLAAGGQPQVGAISGWFSERGSEELVIFLGELDESKAMADDFLPSTPYPFHAKCSPIGFSTRASPAILGTQGSKLSNNITFKQRVSGGSSTSNLLFSSPNSFSPPYLTHSTTVYNDCQSLPNNLPNWKIHPRRLNLHLSHSHVLHRASTQPSLPLNPTHLLELVPPTRSQRHKRINPCRCHPRDKRRIRVYSHAARNITQHATTRL